MPSILVTVFFLQLAIHLVNTIGVSTINTLVNPPEKKSYCSTLTFIAMEYLQPLANTNF
jgi:hypothetical protein